MIYVSCGQHNLIIELLESYEGDIQFVLKGKNGIKLTFETNADEDASVDLAKSIIKNSPLGKALYFQVTK